MNLASFARRGLLATAVLSLAGLNTSCETNAGTGALTGAAVGAGIAAIAGGDNILAGAAIGAAVGAVAGDVLKARRYEGAGGDPSRGGKQYPYATRTGNRNIVRSPYSPNGEVDVTGFRSGELAEDPHTGKIFIVP